MAATRQWRSSAGSPSWCISSRLRSLLHTLPTRDQLAFGSSTTQPSTAVNCSQATCASRWRWRCSWSSPPGCIASSGAARASTAGSQWPRWRAWWPQPGSSVPAQRCSWSWRTARPRSRRGAGVLGRWLAGLQLLWVRVWRVDRGRHRRRAPPPGAAAMDCLDWDPGGADQPRRSARRQRGNRCVFSARLVRPSRRPYLRRLGARSVRGGLAIAPRSNHGRLITSQTRRCARGARLACPRAQPR